jgi:hypothetical protein
MTTRQKVFATAKEMGVTVEQNTAKWGMSEVLLEAPKGYHFMSMGIHSICAEYEAGHDPVPWKGALEDLDYGIEKCDNMCEYWNEDGDMQKSKTCN